MADTLKFLITDRSTKRELGEGYGATKAEALLDLLHRALGPVVPEAHHNGIVCLSEDGARLCFVDDGVAEVPPMARLRRLLGDEHSVSFRRLA